MKCFLVCSRSAVGQSNGLRATPTPSRVPNQTTFGEARGAFVLQEASFTDIAWDHREIILTSFKVFSLPEILASDHRGTQKQTKQEKVLPSYACSWVPRLGRSLLYFPCSEVTRTLLRGTTLTYFMGSIIIINESMVEYPSE